MKPTPLPANSIPVRPPRVKGFSFVLPQTSLLNDSGHGCSYLNLAQQTAAQQLQSQCLASLCSHYDFSLRCQGWAAMVSTDAWYAVAWREL